LQVNPGVSGAIVMTGRRVLALLVASIALGCDDRPLRGSVEPSRDGETYFAVADNHGGTCRIKVDGVPWPHKDNVAARIKPGPHTIDCDGSISFEIPPGGSFQIRLLGSMNRLASLPGSRPSGQQVEFVPKASSSGRRGRPGGKQPANKGLHREGARRNGFAFPRRPVGEAHPAGEARCPTDHMFGRGFDRGHQQGHRSAAKRPSIEGR